MTDHDIAVDIAVTAAWQAFTALTPMSADTRAAIVEAIAEALERRRAEVLPVVEAETALALDRLDGELTRTVNQLRRNAGWVRTGGELAGDDVAVSEVAASGAGGGSGASGGGTLIGRSTVAIGPVAVFGAGNFPLAFGALGTDTAAALAAGCPVVVKGHPSHPRTNAVLQEIARTAIDAIGMPSGMFALIQGAQEIGVALVRHPLMRAVAFTGSQRGGRALADLAAARPQPIPVFAEMGSVNPVMVTPAAAEERSGPIADGLAASVLGSAGQLCTKPGLLLVPDGPAGEAIIARVRDRLAEAGSFTLLDVRIAERFDARTGEVSQAAGVTTVLRGPRDGDRGRSPWLFDAGVLNAATPPTLFLHLAEEIFGPALVVARYPDLAAVPDLVASLGGQLTLSLHGTDADGDAVAPILAAAAQQAGRLVWNGFPTGVAVVEAIHHGGPWPASNSAYGSVGPQAMRRFRRPVAWQGFPLALLPAEIQGKTEHGRPGVL